MQLQPQTSTINSVSFEEVIWSMVVSEDGDSLLLDLREPANKSSRLVRLETNSLTLEELGVGLSWWEELIGVKGNIVYSIKYDDQNNPSDQTFRQLDLQTKKIGELKDFPTMNREVMNPLLYEQGTPFHETVSEFLSVELPLSCEYLEWSDKIIISYYLRSELGFTRFLLLLDNGEKHWKVVQDKQMKGFAPGAFFVLNNQLIFVKERNEVCIYSL